MEILKTMLPHTLFSQNFAMDEIQRASFVSPRIPASHQNGTGH
jgi:hypothetical protein